MWNIFIIFLLTSRGDFNKFCLHRGHSFRKMVKEKGHQTKSVNSLLKGLSVLEAFTPWKNRYTFKELVYTTGLPRTTTFRFLRTLVSREYITFDEKSNNYVMGPKVMSLGFTVLSSMDLRDVASPYLEKLAGESNQNVNLGILDGVDVVYIERIKKWQILDTNVHVGSRFESYRTAIGRAILAFLSEEKFSSVLSRSLKDAAVKRYIGEKGKNLMRILETVRKKGYAVNDEEFIKGLRAIAAPIFNSYSEVEGAINLPVFTQMVNRHDLIERYVPMLLGTAEKISSARGFIKEEK